jgi:hypothetical protein
MVIPMAVLTYVCDYEQMLSRGQRRTADVSPNWLVVSAAQQESTAAAQAAFRANEETSERHRLRG